jgi:hypothetical protein
MAANPGLANPVWSASARYTASGATDILLANASTNYFLRWTITTSDTAPSISYTVANLLGPAESIAMQLADGNRLWVASSEIANVPYNIEV